MTEAAKIIRALRKCKDGEDCQRCPYYNPKGNGDCINRMYADAADMIEKLLVEINGLKKDRSRSEAQGLEPVEVESAGSAMAGVDLSAMADGYESKAEKSRNETATLYYMGIAAGIRRAANALKS